MMWGYDGWAGWGFGMLHMLGFWILLIGAVVLLARWLGAAPGRAPESSAPQETALEVLKKRYARGEIDKSEYEQKKRDLND